MIAITGQPDHVLMELTTVEARQLAALAYAAGHGLLDTFAADLLEAVAVADMAGESGGQSTAGDGEVTDVLHLLSGADPALPPCETETTEPARPRA